MNEKIRILIADDHPIFRRGLRVVVEADQSIEIVAEADDGAAALREIERLAPDVAVLDVDMPQMDGLTVAEEMRKRRLPTAPIFLTMHADGAIFNHALEAGVRGFVVKDGAANEIVACIKAVAGGKSFFSSSLSPFLLEYRRETKSLLDCLTPAEIRVLRMIAEGKTSREIAEELFISPRTVEHHREHIRAKLDLTGKNALLTFALTNKTKILG